MPVYPIEAPIIQVTPPLEPVHRAAPTEVVNYLISRGWQSIHNNLWINDCQELIGLDFQWPEALAYEVFQNFVMLKTAGE